jgi:hypothetical protein
MPAKPRRPFWWRFPAPSTLLFLLIIGVLPWIEVGCKGDPKALQQNNQGGGGFPGAPAAPKKDLKVAEDGYFIVAKQNGYQAIWGGTSPGRDMRAIEREFTKDAKPSRDQSGGNKQPTGTREKPKDNGPSGAPLIAIYFVLILAAAGVGFGMPPGLWRSIAFGGAVFLAAVMLLVQTLIGFPIADKWEKDMKQGSEVLAKDWKPYSSFTIFYYFNWPFLLGPLALVGVEELLNLGTGKPKKKRRFDEDEDEDEDDRPRGKRRRDEDEEDDRPRKRRRSQDDDDDEEEARPRRKSAAPARDEDEPPPKRRVAADDRLTGTPRRKAAPPPDDEDEPPRKRRPAPVEDEDDRPRKRKRFHDD